MFSIILHNLHINLSPVLTLLAISVFFKNYSKQKLYLNINKYLDFFNDKDFLSRKTGFLFLFHKKTSFTLQRLNDKCDAKKFKHHHTNMHACDEKKRDRNTIFIGFLP